MPTPATALSLMMLLATSQGPGAPEIQKAGCHIVIDGVCRVEKAPQVAANAGSGGAGGNATVNYNFYLGGPQAGNGGNGGNVKGSSGPASISPPAPSPPVSLTLSRCKLMIAGKAEVDARGCKYDKVGQAFTVVAPSDNQKYVYTIKVAINEDKTGVGSLSGGRTTAVRSLGKLVRRGACWVSEDASVEICAWK